MASNGNIVAGSANMSLSKPSPLPAASAALRRRPKSSILAVLVALCGIALLSTILHSLVTRQLDPKGCRMSYMRPSYHRFDGFDTEHTRFATKYSLYLYREQGVDVENKVCLKSYKWT